MTQRRGLSAPVDDDKVMMTAAAPVAEVETTESSDLALQPVR